MIDFYFIRHGEAEHNALNPELMCSRSDEARLTQLGREQAALLGCRLFDEGVILDKMYSSPAVRPRETAEIALSYMGRSIENVIVDERLIEMSHGTAEGMPRKEVFTPERLVEIDKDIWNYRWEEGESQRDVAERMMSWVEDAIQELGGSDATVGVFTHSMAIKCLVAEAMDMDRARTRFIGCDYTSITRLIYREEGLQIQTLNDSYHIREFL